MPSLLLSDVAAGAISMKHSELVTLAGRWLARQRCSVIVTEMATSGEIPDAIGWVGGYSIVIECKVSVQDFRCEQPYRIHRPNSLGRERYYLVPSGLITLEMLPPKWGLLELVACGIRVTKKPERVDDWDAIGETRILCSCLRRVFKAGSVVGMNVKTYTIGANNAGAVATLGVEVDDESQQPGGAYLPTGPSGEDLR